MKKCIFFLVFSASLSAGLLLCSRHEEPRPNKAINTGPVDTVGNAAMLPRAGKEESIHAGVKKGDSVVAKGVFSGERKGPNTMIVDNTKKQNTAVQISNFGKGENRGGGETLSPVEDLIKPAVDVPLLR